MYLYIKRIIIIWAAAATVYACAPSMTVRESKMELPGTFNETLADSLNVASMPWKDFYTEPELQILIEQALANNQELNIMLQQVAMAQNEIQARKGEYLPFVTVNAGAEVEKVGKNTRNGAVEENLPIAEGKPFPDPLTNYSTRLSATWELDVWKKLRNAKKAAVLEYLATQEGRNFMITNLVSEIADAYYELLALDARLSIIDENLSIQNDALRIVRLQKEAARATELAVQRFEAEVFKNRSERFKVKQEITVTQNRINFLLGRQPEAVARGAQPFLDRVIDSMATGLPSQLLRNRADVRQAEQELASAKINVMVARANFYPSFALRANVGLEAFNPQYLTRTPESLLYGLMGDMVAPLINRNAIKATYNNANARQLQAVFEYEKTVLNGYIEVVNELSNIQNLNESYSLKASQVNALTKSIEISNRLFQSARADYMEVLLTQRDALESKIELVETRKEQYHARNSLFRALGGGWQ
ncbi:MAG: TolC family protein [Nonlabens sp.]|nr:TolC family protein [Nonlabens sp.]